MRASIRPGRRDAFTDRRQHSIGLSREMQSGVRFGVAAGFDACGEGPADFVANYRAAPLARHAAVPAWTWTGARSASMPSSKIQSGRSGRLYRPRFSSACRRCTAAILRSMCATQRACQTRVLWDQVCQASSVAAHRRGPRLRFGRLLLGRRSGDIDAVVGDPGLVVERFGRPEDHCREQRGGDAGRQVETIGVLARGEGGGRYSCSRTESSGSSTPDCPGPDCVRVGPEGQGTWWAGRIQQRSPGDWPGSGSSGSAHVLGEPLSWVRRGCPFHRRDGRRRGV